MKEYSLLGAIFEFKPLHNIPKGNLVNQIEERQSEVINSIMDFEVVRYWLNNSSNLSKESIEHGALELQTEIEEWYEPIHVDRFDLDFVDSFSDQDQLTWKTANEVLGAMKSQRTTQVRGLFRGIDIVILKEIASNPCLQECLRDAEERFHQEDAEKVFTKAGIIQIARRHLEIYESMITRILQTN